MLGLPRFPMIFLSVKSKGTNFARFYASKFSFFWKTAKLDSFVLSDWEKEAPSISKICWIF